MGRKLKLVAVIQMKVRGAESSRGTTEAQSSQSESAALSNGGAAAAAAGVGSTCCLVSKEAEHTYNGEGSASREAGGAEGGPHGPGTKSREVAGN